jgi:MFS family permease
VLLAGAAAPALMRRSVRGCIFSGLLLSGCSVGAFPWVDRPWAWFLLRLAAGGGGALTMVALETLINFNAPPNRRARHFGFYACAVGVGFALGSSIGLHLFDTYPLLSFAIGGSVTVAALPLLPLLPACPVASTRSERVQPLRPPFLCYASSWSQGFLEAGMLSLLPLYLRSIGMHDARAGTLIGGILIGVLVCQLPIGWLADRLGRERVLIGCFAIVGAGLLAAPYSEQAVWLPFWLTLVGVFSGALYPLGLSLLGERLQPDNLPRANAWYIGINCFGSMINPLMIGPLMEQFGGNAMFWSSAAVVIGFLVAWLWLRCPRKQASQQEVLASDMAANALNDVDPIGTSSTRST